MAQRSQKSRVGKRKETSMHKVNKSYLDAAPVTSSTWINHHINSATSDIHTNDPTVTSSTWINHHINQHQRAMPRTTVCACNEYEWGERIISTSRAASTTRQAGSRHEYERGEGIISTAIAVLIVAFLGAAMWIAFDNIWGSAETSIREQVQIIGTDSTD